MAATASAPTRSEQKRLTREALKDAAMRCFAEYGFSATQIGHITEAAGVAKGTFYVHFQDKDEVLEELLTAFNKGFAQRVAPLLQSADLADIRGLARRVAGIFLDYWDENRAFIRAYSEKAAGGIAADRLPFGLNPPMQAMLTQALAGLRAKNRRHIHPDLIVQALLSMWLRLGLQYVFNEDATRKAVVDTLADMTEGALRGALS